MKRATFTEAEVVRLGRAAEKLGKTLVVMRDGGFVFADPDKVALPSRKTERGNSCDEAFGVGS